MTKDTHGSNHKGWIGVDLDGTLAVYHGWISAKDIGPPVEAMAGRVLDWLKHGQEVRIFTARVAPGKPDAQECLEAIRLWCLEIFGRTLVVTHEKDQHMLELWDDRAVQVIPNTGKRADSIANQVTHHFWRVLCRLGNHDFRDGPGSKCRTCSAKDEPYQETPSPW